MNVTYEVLANASTKKDVIPASAYGYMFGMLILGLVLGAVLSPMVRSLMRGKKPQVFFHDPDGGTWEEYWPSLNGNEFTRKFGDQARTFILEQKARIGKNTWILHPRHGHNMVGPSDAETVNSSPLMLKLAVANPALYHYMISRNRPRDAMQANAKDDKGNWIVPLAIIGFVALIAVLGVVGFIAWKVTSGPAAPVSQAMGGP